MFFLIEPTKEATKDRMSPGLKIKLQINFIFINDKIFN